jgi:exosortase C (VPDSG-CTERM-specific)
VGCAGAHAAAGSGGTLLTSITDNDTGALASWRALPRPERVRFSCWAAWIAVGTLAFVQPLANLVVYATQNSLNSHNPLIPVIAGYLLFIRRHTLPPAGRRSIAGTVIMLSVCAAALATALGMEDRLSGNDRLSLTTLAYLGFVAAGGFLFVGTQWMAAAASPLLFLLFMVPLPDALVHQMETASMLASADVTAWLLTLTATPFVRDGTVFALPTIVLEVAEECSGIRSSWVLFITSFVAANMFLGSPWRKVVLVLFVIPLGIVRNGFRILVLSLLCVHVGPHMIDSVIHHRGGPIFFALSLVPLLGLLMWLRRHDRQA